MAPQLAWVGLGNMGRGMSKNLVEKGRLEKPLILFNRTVERAHTQSDALPKGKSSVATSLDQAVYEADIIFTCLGNDAAIEETIATALKNNVKGKLFVECSTVHPDTTKMLADRIQGQGAEMVAAPVFGAPAMADAGQLVINLAGPAAAVGKVRPYCKEIMGREIIDLSGQPHQKASLLKILGNSFILNMIEALAEGHTLAEKSGLGTENLHKFVESMFPGPYVAYSKRLLSGDYHKREEPLFGVDLARKDARHVLNLAEAADTRLKDLEVADNHLAAVQKHSGSKGDIAGIYGAVREEAGLKFEN